MSFLSNPQKILAFALAALLVLPAPTPLAAQSMNVVDLSMTIGKSLVIDYPVEIGRISTSSPEVVDAVPATAKEFLLHGKGHGAATVVVWAKSGARTMYNITVEHNVEPIRKLLSETFPSEDIRIQSGRDSITLVGKVSSKDVADRAVAIATPLAKTVVTYLQVATAPVEQQIILRVKFAELNRNSGTQLGFNLFSTGTGGTIGGISTNQYTPPSLTTVRAGSAGGAANPVTFSITDTLNIFAFRPDLNLGAAIRALQNQDVLQILAEPNLTTLNGKEASFLAGGEFPVPILQGGGNAGAVTVQFREYGIRLNFNPTITPNGTIKMYVKPEVSTIDISNSVSLSGFTIPALATRRMETNVELKEGQSFMIAGLMDDRVTDQMSKLPGLASVPILGALFKSRLDRKSKTELIVIVTPEIVKPYNPDDKLPVPEFPKEWLQPFKVPKKVSDPVRQTSSLDGPKKAEVDSKNPFLFWKSSKKAGQLAGTSTAPKLAADPAPATNGLNTTGPDTTGVNATGINSVGPTPASDPTAQPAASSSASPAPAVPADPQISGPAPSNPDPASPAPASPAPASPAPASPAPASHAPASPAPASPAPAGPAPAGPAPAGPAPAGPAPVPLAKSGRPTPSSGLSAIPDAAVIGGGGN
jgi:pilus assembly protein CpaC